MKETFNVFLPEIEQDNSSVTNYFDRICFPRLALPVTETTHFYLTQGS